MGTVKELRIIVTGDCNFHDYDFLFDSIASVLDIYENKDACDSPNDVKFLSMMRNRADSLVVQLAYSCDYDVISFIDDSSPNNMINYASHAKGKILIVFWSGKSRSDDLKKIIDIAKKNGLDIYEFEMRLPQSHWL